MRIPSNREIFNRQQNQVGQTMGHSQRDTTGSDEQFANDKLRKTKSGDGQNNLRVFPSADKTSIKNEIDSAKSKSCNRSRYKLVHCSPVMERVLNDARLFAQSLACVLITGENGTGKEMIARYVHEHSTRADKVFVRVNCAALSESLVESELFGHEQGSFTGANSTRIGFFEFAAGGTIMLDEISEIPLKIQAKLLRVLDHNEFQRVGSNETLTTNARVIATSNRNLQKQVKNREFREDLYYRLNVLPLHVPPMRYRKDEIGALVQHFVELSRGDTAIPIQRFSNDALNLLIRHKWPGNVRELRNVVQRACVRSTSQIVQSDSLDIEASCEEDLPQAVLDMTLEKIEKVVILATLKRFKNNKTHTAEHLGITTRTLLNKENRYRQQGHLN